MNEQLSFLVIDDEESLRLTLATLIREEYPTARIDVANDGFAGWNQLQKHRPAVIISDISMPHLDGISLCKKVKADANFRHIYFIVATAMGSREQEVHALEAGVDDFLSKPVTQDKFVARLRSAVRIVGLQHQLAEENEQLRHAHALIKQYSDDMLALSQNLLAAKLPQTKDISMRIHHAALFVAKAFGDFSDHDMIEIDIASRLCLIGKLYLPDTLIHTDVIRDAHPTHDLMFQVPIYAQQLVSAAKRFENIGVILRHVYENYDGTGFPDRLQAWEIPLASRLLRVIHDYVCYYLPQTQQPRKAMEIIKNHAKQIYDQRFVEIFDQYVWKEENSLHDRKVRPLHLYELQPGMTVARQVVTNSGLILLNTDSTLSEKSIERILAHNTTDPILGYVYVKE